MSEYPGQIGIDLGTTISCVAFWDGDHVEIICNKNGSKMTPSWVAFTDTEILVGETAKDQAARNPENTVFDVKRILGKHFSDDTVQSDIDHYPFEVVGDRNDIPTIKVQYKGEERTFKPEQISAMVLNHMREIAEDRLGMKVRKAVITVPAYFNDSQRTATKNAAAIAGLECDKIINEPTAACMCYGLDKRENNSKVLIFDLGGGTFDVSILNLCQGIFEVLSTSGDTHLGGEDFDNIIVREVTQDFAKKNKLNLELESLTYKSQMKLKNAAEKAKKVLSEAQYANIEIENFYEGHDLTYRLTRNKFETWCMPLFKKCLEPVRKALEDSHLESGEINEVVLVGGSTRIPKVQELLCKFFDEGRKGSITLNKSVNPDEAVAYGAAIEGAILSKTDTSGKTKELLLLDVTPLSLGIESKGGQMSKIIERNSQIPIKKNKIYSTVEDQQTAVMIKIFEGERPFTKDNHKIGDFELCDIPRQPRGVPKIDVQFSIDANGILTVRAIDKETGESNEITATNTTRLSQEEINKMIDEADEFRADDELKKESLNYRYQFEKELMFAQQSINDEELIVDEDGNEVITEPEISWMNQAILSNLTWLEDNEDLNKTKIEEAKNIFIKATKHIMSRIFARKKQVELATKYMPEEKELGTDDIQKVANMAFGEEEAEAASAPKPKVLPKLSISKVEQKIKLTLPKSKVPQKTEPEQPKVLSKTPKVLQKEEPILKVLPTLTPKVLQKAEPTLKIKPTIALKPKVLPILKSRA